MYFDKTFPKDADGNSLYPCLEQYTAPVKPAEREIVGREIEKGRVMAAMERPELCNVILLAEAGSGKALANDTKIPVCDSRGFVEIGDIKVGDIVFDDSGSPTEVIGVYPQGLKQAYKVTFADGSEVVCNDEHLWQAKTFYQYYSGQSSETMTLKKMMSKGIRINSGRSKWYIPVANKVQRLHRTQAFPAYALGVLAGSMNKISDDIVSLSFRVNRKEVVNKFAQLIGANEVKYNRKTNSYSFYRRKDKELVPIPLQAIRDAVFENGLIVDCLPRQRRLPDDYILGSIEQRKELLRGIMDATGYVENNKSCGIGIKVQGKPLACDIKSLVKSLGIAANISKCNEGGYLIRLTLDPAKKAGLFGTAKLREKASLYDNSKVKSVKRYDGLAITNVTRLREEVPMTCIMVKSESHLFLCTENYIVTHNTALVQGTMLDDMQRYYLEVDIPKIIAGSDDPSKVANEIKNLFDEVQKFCHQFNTQIVLFIDEFHQIVQASPQSVEALKPLLADSGTRGIRVIAATTYVEFRQWISPNQPLVERLQRINLEAPDKKMVVTILRGMAKRYGVDHQFTDDRLFEEIYDLTNRYIPANAQPRKSILVLDSMVGWHRYQKRKFNKRLLADVIYESENVNIAFRVDATKIKSMLDEHVFAQQYATTAIQNRLQICVADLNDKSKPMSSLLFCGPTGSGKQCSNDTLVPVFPTDGNNQYWKRHGDLVPGDIVVARDGLPTVVTEVFKHTGINMYRVTLADGRTLDVGEDHLWGVYSAKQRSMIENEGRSSQMRVMNTKEILEAGLYNTYQRKDCDKVGNLMKWYIPMNEAVQWPECDYEVDPYVIGALIGNGCLVMKALTLSSNDNFVTNEVAKLLGSPEVVDLVSTYNYCFRLKEKRGRIKNIQTVDVVGDMPEIYNKKSREKRIPERYMYGSIEQRWALVQGLFDTDGSISSDDSARVSYSTFSKGLAEDVQKLLYSLGVSSAIQEYVGRKIKDNDEPYIYTEYRVRVKSENDLKYRFFRTPVKLEKAKAAANIPKQRNKKFRTVGIKSIEYIGVQDAQCIMVDNEEHLYQAGDFVVTHNTETTKQLAKILFNDERRLIRFDMSEYANADSLDQFRKELTARVWERPYSIILLDEIEKSCAPVTRLLLQVLDDGRLTDENGREVSFINSYIILTTNAGNEIYDHMSQYNISDTGDGSAFKELQRLIRNSITNTAGQDKFPPELLGRIDCIVPFQPLSRNTQERILRNKIDKLSKEIREKHNILLRFSDMDKICRFIIDDNLDTEASSGGARRVISKYEEEIVTKIAEAINASDQFTQELTISIQGELATDDKHKRTSSAYVQVSQGKSTTSRQWT